MHAAFLRISDFAYTRLLRPLIFRSSAQTAHERMMRLLRFADRWVTPPLGAVHRLAFADFPVSVGGVSLSAPLILAAGLVKGDGFDSEAAALAAVRAGRNIIPGWRCMPRLVGPVEFGSFTCWPRLGNPGVVVWRDVPTRSTQNRVGLRNPGALAAAEFLAAHKTDLPPVFGINIAVSPGVDDPDQQTDEVIAALNVFIERGVYPAWFTLNLSCPNTEDDPTGHQTADGARQLCAAAVAALNLTPKSPLHARRGGESDDQAPSPRVETYVQHTRDYRGEVRNGAIPLWVKLGPNLSAEQVRALMAVFAETGVRAVVATNTLPQPSPTDSTVTAGVGGGRLHAHALQTAAALVQEKTAHAYPVDVIGCGGVLDGAAFRAFADLGISTVQYWSALVYRGPLAAALIVYEAKNR
jgi:dihydroorotate dehydrogenase